MLSVVQKKPTREPAATELTTRERRYSLHHLIKILDLDFTLRECGRN